jgi:hypothetical protein
MLATNVSQGWASPTLPLVFISYRLWTVSGATKLELSSAKQRHIEQTFKRCNLVVQKCRLQLFPVVLTHLNELYFIADQSSSHRKRRKSHESL